MKSWCFAAWVLIGLCALSSCAKSRSPSAGSSETHFLLRCSDDNCGDGLKCICGACSKACSSDASCSGLSDSASCVLPAEDECDEGRSCDVECKVSADCAPLSERHECVTGRCRAPAAKADSMPTAPAPMKDSGVACTEPNCTRAGALPTPTSCELPDVVVALSSVPLLDCGQLPINPAGKELTVAIDCVRNALAASQPFSLLWSLQGTDSAIQRGFVGVPGDNGLRGVYTLWYDSAGTAPAGAMSYWSPCATFSLRDDCYQLDPVGSVPDSEHCFQCEARAAEECNCSDALKSADPPSVSCRVAPGSSPSAAIDPPPCGKSSCEFDGVCYPDGTSTEDGCCSCDNGMGSCDEPGWCPGWKLIGRRCDVSSDCTLGSPDGSALQCRRDLVGERGLCTRDCNFGCPTGTECVAEVPDSNGGSIENICMRTCDTQADCEMLPGPAGFGGTCETHGKLTRSYCF